MAERHPDNPPQRFLLDEDVEKLSSLFPKKRVRTLKQVGLSHGATDDAIVKKAWHRGFTVVTANKVDYRRAVERFVKRQPPHGDCGCPYGLVFLPSGHATQERLLPRLRYLEDQLRIGKERFRWKDIHERHFLVNVQRNGKVDVRRLPRCPSCTTLH